MRILAVDDDAFILELIPKVLARLGFDEVTTASSGDLALSAISDAPHCFECILLDISMTGMDGITLCRRIRALPAYVTTPIIMLTALTQHDFLDRAFDAGATGYTTKPFDFDKLAYQLRRAQESQDHPA